MVPGSALPASVLTLLEFVEAAGNASRRSTAARFNGQSERPQLVFIGATGEMVV